MDWYTRNRFSHSIAFVVLAVIAVFASPRAAASPAVVISEIMFNPDGDENAREYIELVNRSDTAVSLEGWTLSDSSATDTIIPLGGGWTVAPGGFALILDPDYPDDPDPYDIPPGVLLLTVADRALGSRGLSNSSAEPVSLLDNTGTLASRVRYSLDCPAGYSWERVQSTGSDSVVNFRPGKLPGGSPGRTNSATPPQWNPSLPAGSLVIRTTSPTAGEPVEITLTVRNSGIAPLDTIRVQLRFLPDGIVSEAVFTGTLAPGGATAPHSLTLPAIPAGRPAIEAVILPPVGRVTDTADDTVRVTVSVPVPSGAVILNEIMAAPADNGPEWVEILAAGQIPVDLAGWSIADEGSSVTVTTDHLILDPGEYCVIGGAPMPASELIPSLLSPRFPALNNDGDRVALIDPFGVIADSIRYTDAPEGRSLELISPEKRGTATGWETSVDTTGATPGKPNSIKFPPASVDGDPEHPRLTLTVNPSPFEGETTLSYQLPFPLARVRLIVYDRRGRIVARIRDSEESGATWSMRWNGRTSDGPLPIGPYILVLEALDKETGRVTTVRVPFVIARRL